MDYWVQIDINVKLKRDLKYIENDIICKQLSSNTKDEGEKYIKFCRALNMIGVIDMTEKQYKKYWNTQYLDFPDKKKQIFEAINNKFKNGLTSKKEMIKIIKECKDFDSEKERALKVLKGGK